MKEFNKEAGSREVADFISKLDPEKKKLLTELREYIKSIVPEATEKISWWMPMFYYRSKQMVGYAAFKNHCSFFGMWYDFIEEFKEEIKDYLESKATLHFTSDHQLPKSLVKKIVEFRINAINESLAKKK